MKLFFLIMTLMCACGASTQTGAAAPDDHCASECEARGQTCDSACTAEKADGRNACLDHCSNERARCASTCH